MTTIDTLEMIAAGQNLTDLIGQRANTPHGVGVIEQIEYNLYPVVRVDDSGKTYRCDSLVELV